MSFKTKINAALLLLMTFLILAFLSGCGNKKVIVEKEYVQDSTVIRELLEEREHLHERLAHVKSEKELIERAMASLITGSTGEKDSTSPIPVKDLYLTAGDDYLKLNGQWLWLDHEWYRAPRESRTYERTDSLAREYSLISERNIELAEENVKLRHYLSEKEEKSRSNWLWWAGVGMFVGVTATLMINRYV